MFKRESAQGPVHRCAIAAHGAIKRLAGQPNSEVTASFPLAVPATSNDDCVADANSFAKTGLIEPLAVFTCDIPRKVTNGPRFLNVDPDSLVVMRVPVFKHQRRLTVFPAPSRVRPPESFASACAWSVRFAHDLCSIWYVPGPSNLTARIERADEALDVRKCCQAIAHAMAVTTRTMSMMGAP